MFRVSYISKKKKAAAAGASDQPAAKKARTARGPARVTGSSPPPPQDMPALEPARSPTAIAPVGPSSLTGARNRQSLLENPEAAWQKLVGICNDEGMSSFRGAESKQIAMDLNHGLFQTLIRSYAIFNRLGNTERALGAELENKRKLLTELGAAKNVAAVAQAERDEIVAHEKVTNEENKRLKSENARLLRDRDSLSARVAEMTEELKEAGSRAIEEFKKTDDFQELIMPVFLEGFEHARQKISAALPDFDASVLEPGEDEEEEEGDVLEEEGEVLEEGAADRGDAEGPDPGAIDGQTGGEPVEVDREEPVEPDEVLEVVHGDSPDPDRAA